MNDNLSTPLTKAHARTPTGPNDLLYVSDGAFHVFVYSYPDGIQEQQLSFPGEPSGMCTDAAGDVFITQNTYANIVEYAHGGTSPIATLKDPGARPLGCAADPVTDDLAVTSYSGKNPGDPGNVAIFVHANGFPRVYQDSKFIFYFFATYDASGNLFIDGQSKYLRPVVAELQRGKTSLVTLQLHGLPGDFYLPSAIVWDGKYLALGDLDRSTIYRLKVSGTTATVVGSTKLLGGKGVNQFVIEPQTGNEKRLVGPNYDGTAVGIWNYPAGGQPIKQISGVNQPVGVAISGDAPISSLAP